MKLHDYRKGFLTQYTGKYEMIYGGLFFEVIFLEGPYKGKKEYTQYSPMLAPVQCWITKEEAMVWFDEDRIQNCKCPHCND